MKDKLIIHAEEDVIFRSALLGVCTAATVMYVPWALCVRCARAVIQAGIRQVVVHQQAMDKTPNRWRGAIEEGVALLTEVGIEYEQYDGAIGEITN